MKLQVMKMKRKLVIIFALIMVLVFTFQIDQSNPDIMIEKGMTREQVMNRLGKPEAELSGLDGEVFELNGKTVVVYYTKNEHRERVVEYIR